MCLHSRHQYLGGAGTVGVLAGAKYFRWTRSGIGNKSVSCFDGVPKEASGKRGFEIAVS